MKKSDLKDIYPLSPLQEGLLFHHLYDKESTAYFEQVAYRLTGNLDLNAFEASWNDLLMRHDILRTVFIYEQASRPLQVVVKERKIEFNYHDIRSLAANEQHHHLSDFKQLDRKKSFDLSNDVLMRLNIFQIHDNDFYVVWSHHHILIDGWSVGILYREFVKIYESLTKRQPAELPPPTPYSHFIKWLETRDHQRTENFWKKYLSGYQQQTVVPKYHHAKETDTDRREKSHHFTLDIEQTLRLNQLAAENHVTINTVIQCLWAILLAKYNHVEDVIFGVTASVRPEVIKGINDMVGLFINTIPTRINVEHKLTWSELLQKVQQEAIELSEHHYYPLNKIQNHAPFRELFDHILVFENYPLDEQLRDNKDVLTDLKLDQIEFSEEIHYDLGLIVVPGEKLAVKFTYNPEVYESSQFKQIAGHWQNIIAAVLNDQNILLKELKILSDPEKYHLIKNFNNTGTDYPRDKTIVELFEEQVAKTPDHIAVGFKEQQLTYKNLNERANQLARHLTGQYDIQPDDLIGVMLDRSEQMVIAILAILKSGGAYVPIDPEYPVERIDYIVKDIAGKLIITEKKHANIVSSDSLIFIEEIAKSDDSSNLTRSLTPNHLAYVIYTSGSTGQPKGVMVEHRSIVRLVKNTNYIAINAADRILQTGPLSFDASTFEIWGALLNGASVYLTAEREILDVKALGRIINDHGITIIWLTSSLFNQMVERDESIFAGLRSLLVGGERLSPPHINKLRLAHPQLEIINGYGPTENTTFTCCYNIQQDFHTDIPIGQPISNTRVYLLDHNYEPVPIGVPGYLYISGDGLARGYLNGEELTQEKFLPCPFEPGERMYYSGDLVRWLPDGNIEFLGRQDDQVKIRGYRIECGEIEHTLLKHPDIKAAVVVAREIEGGYKELVAYVVSEKALNISELRGFLVQFIPDYMVPSKFVSLESIPLTANKKVDKRALPAPDEMGMETGTDYCPPTNEVEEHLAKIWEEVIGRNQIGINDNYFDIGGDSIKAIQIMARLQKVNLKCEISDFFKFPTIKDLAPRVLALEKWIPQEPVTGSVPLTPIQHWFFKAVQGPDKHHFNHSVLLYANARLDENVLSAVFQKIINHHDALRMTYKTGGHQIIQENQPYINFNLETIILQNESEPAQKLTDYANQIHSGFNLETGPLIKVVLFRLDDGDRLLIVIHHLVIDGVSWRILFEDIATGYELARAGKSINLPPKTHSYQAWAKFINKYSRTEALLQEFDYWKQIEKQIITQKLSYKPAPKVIEGGTKTLTVTLAANETENLLTKTNQAYKTNINDILLTALAVAFNQWHGDTKTIINLESHGRENLGDLDISRTIGWFTSIYPVTLDLGGIEGIESQLKTIKETLRQVPKNGIGYNILKYLTSDNSLNSPASSISFNYLGQFDQDLPSNLFQIAKESSGNAVSPKLVLPEDLLLSGIITNHRLSVSLTFKPDKFHSDRMQQLLEAYLQELRLIIEHCQNKTPGEITPSDLSYSDLSLTELDTLLNSVSIPNSKVQDIYPLSPMQEGLLFHYLYDPETTAFFQQMNYRLEGQLDIHLVEEAWNYLFKRHEVLRTIFVYQNIKRPLQIVLTERRIEFEYQDIRGLTQTGETEHFLAQLMAADRQRPFNLSKDVLMRVAIIQSGENEYYLLWTFHHILLDGWCLGILYSEFLEVYQALSRDEAPQLPLTRPYADYLKWLALQDQAAAGKYWKEYLSSYQQMASIPHYLPALQLAQPENLAKVKPYLFELNEEITAALRKQAAQANVTLNTVIQSLWAILLALYNDTDDVVFGIAVAGRPEEITGIENMVGLFMNTIPVRINAKGELIFSQLLQAVQENAIRSKEHAYYPLAGIQANSALKQGLFDHILVYENYPIDNLITASEKCPAFKVSAPDLYREINYDLGLLINPGKTVEFHVLYNPSVYAQAQIEQIERFLTKLSRLIIAEENIRLQDLNILSTAEGLRVLEGASHSNPLLWQLFEKQVQSSLAAAPEVKASVLNRYQNFVPEGVIGEIYLGTETPTGFKGRWLWDGRLEITQEPDDLAIIGGESIALQTLNSILLSHDAIRDCELIKKRDGTGESFILALIEIRERITESQILEYLSQALSETYLEKISFLLLPALPLDEGGKVNTDEILQKIPILQPGLLPQIEADILQQIPELDQIAVLPKNREIKSSHLHMNTLLTSKNVHINELLPKEEDEFKDSLKSESQGAAETTATVMALSKGGEVILDPQEPQTMVDALYRAARDFSDKGTVYVNEEGVEEYQSYADLLKEASCILNGLLDHGVKPGDKIILQLEDLREHLTSFWACILGGIRPVTVATSPTYEQKTSVVNKLYNAWELLEHPFILASRHLVEPINGLNQMFSTTGLTAISISGYPPIESDYRATPEQIAFYQLTSGSTGIPKCIQERHKGIYYHVYGAKQYNDYTSDDVYLTWPPSDHVGALITLYIKAVYLGVLQLAVKTDLILNNPLKWLDLLEKYRVTFTWSPNFGYKLVAEQLKKTDRQWDLSSVRFFMNAAEQVTLPVVEEFLSLTKDFGVPEHAMQPAYGMAETCTAMQYKNDFSVATGFHWFEKSSLKGLLKATANRGKEAVSFVKLGKPMPGVQIRIVDEKNQLIPEGKIGSLHIKGEVITPGYFNNPEANQEAFVGDGWFNTGDLGFILNGELSITGRQKEVIIIRATNFYCYEIEDVVNRVEGVEPTFAGSSAIDDPASGSEGLAIFFSPKPDVDMIQLIKAIRTQIASECGINPSYVIPIDKEIFPKTTSGKIQRTQMRHALEQGVYNEIIKTIDIGLENDRTLPDWFFKTAWRKKALRGERRANNQRNYLVLSDNAELFAGLEHGIQVKTGQAFGKENSYSYTINPAHPEDYLDLLAAVKAEGIELDTIIHALSYDNNQEVQTLTELKQSQSRGVFSVLFLVKAIAKQIPALARLVVVSSRTQAVQPGEFISYDKGTLRGLLKTITQEFSSLICQHIDLEATDLEPDSTHILSELEHDSRDLEVTYRKGNRYIAGLKKIDFSTEDRQPIPFKENGFYLITGGLGAIGTEIANLLLTHYNARLLLIGRTELANNPERLNAFHRLTKAGHGEVQYQAIDTCDQAGLQAAIKNAETTWGQTLSGILHLAGEANIDYHQDSLDDHHVVNEQLAVYDKLFHAKVYGTFVLMELIKDSPEALFISFSSVNSWFGGSGFGAYSSANSFLDALTHYYHNHQQQPAYCFNWSMWEGMGMSRGNVMKDAVLAKGFHSLSLQQGLKSFLVGMELGIDQLIIGLDPDNRFIKSYMEPVPLPEQSLTVCYTLKEHIDKDEEVILSEINDVVRVHLRKS